MLAISPKVAVVIVTHNSEKHIDKCITCVEEQTYAASQVIIVDSGSSRKDYLHKYSTLDGMEVVFGASDIGFCRGNNLGLSRVQSDVDYLFFLNPDAFLTPTFIQKAVEFMEDGNHARCGAITGTTLGYDMQQGAPTGLYDSTGVFRKWWGRWYDRAQAEAYRPQAFTCHESISAICGAVFFCRRSAANEVLLPGEELFDSRFYMYKEDIDLSLRLIRRGWQLMFVPQLVAYHCRGWNPHRQSMPKKMRLHSAYNELSIHLRQRSPIPILYSLMKYFAVKCFNF